MQVQAILTEVRQGGMQKWERPDLSKNDHARYIWLSPYENRKQMKVGTTATLAFQKGTGGAIGGHWSGWRIVNHDRLPGADADRS